MPVDRAAAACGSYAGRVTCWGGYSHVISHLASDAANVWPGIPLAQVQQQLPVLEGDAALPLQQSPQASGAVLRDLQYSLSLAFTRDIACYLKLSMSCGYVS